LGSQGVFSPILIHLIRSGEASGNLGVMLKHASENAELESEQKAKMFTSLIEPILIFVMGLLVLLIVMAVMQPILEMNTGVR
jgi:general secretion pathway protein F